MEKFEHEVLSKIVSHLIKSSDVAFVIEGKRYSYKALRECVSKIRTHLQTETFSTTNIGLVLNNDIETYASIIALWLEGLAYVPLNPMWPIERCENIISQVNLSLILDSGSEHKDWSVKVINTVQLPPTEDNLIIVDGISGERYAYILFTSGSTGTPKGVPISRSNLATFVDSMNNIGLGITSADRCLQPFDLSFDFSVSSYVIPLVKGASIYTVPSNTVKYTYIASLIIEEHLTVLQMVPSMIRNLLPYIDEIDLTSVRYNIICGEALLNADIANWHKANPQMVSYNMYGPTENTVFCTYYVVNESNQNKIINNNGIVSIGRTFPNSKYIIVDETDHLITKDNVEGELCLAGGQLTPGYWKNDKDNVEKFFYIDGERFYRSGDLCYLLSNELMYVCRKDSQVKINGYRVELGEIENIFCQYANKTFCVALPYSNDEGSTEIALVFEDEVDNIKTVEQKMSEKLTKYMMPKQYHSLDIIPLNQNGKIDRKQLYNILNLKKI